MTSNEQRQLEIDYINAMLDNGIDWGVVRAVLHTVSGRRMTREIADWIPADYDD